MRYTVSLSKQFIVLLLNLLYNAGLGWAAGEKNKMPQE